MRRILVAGQMGIGNMVMFTPLLRALRRGFPQAHIAVAFWKRNGADEIIRSSPFVDEVILLESDHLPLWKRAQIGVKLGMRGWDLAIVRFNGGSPEILSALATGRIPYRAGHVSSGGWNSGSDFLYNIPISMGPGTHEIDRYLAIATGLGICGDERGPAVHVGPTDERVAARFLAERGISAEQPWVAIHPGTSASQTWKRWPADRWRVLVAQLSAARIPVVALGSADERALVEEVCNGTPAVPAAGEFTLQQSAAVLARASVLVCTDSSLMHIAAALGKPVVALFGPTDVLRTRPFGVGHAVIQPDGCAEKVCYSVAGQLRHECGAGACMARIEPDRVLSAVSSHLDFPGRVPPAHAHAR